MRFKTLLLGSATAFAFAGGAAQAADLSVAEPVDYVRVCDAFGAGFWYIPGTDTCIAISGKVTFETTFKGEDYVVAPHAGGDDHPFSSGHEGNWDFKTSADFNVMSKSMTDWGPLTAFVAFTASSDNTKDGAAYDDGAPFDPWTQDTNKYVKLDEAYLSLGPILAGYTGSAFNVGVPFTEGGDDLSDDDVDQIQLSWAINGFGLVLAVEDPRDRWSSAETNDLPDLVAAMSFSAAGWDAKVAFLYGDTQNDSSWAVNGSLGTEVGIWQFEVGALYIETPTCGPFCGPTPTHPSTNFAVNDGWAAYIGAQQNWTPNFYTAQHFQWEDDADSGENWDAAFTVAFSPATDMWMRADASTTNEGDDWTLLLQLEKGFGPNQ